MEPNANDDAIGTGWRSSEPTGLSMYREGKSLGTVWHDQDTKTWSALVSMKDRQATQDGFLSMKEAQVWCEGYIAQGGEQLGLDVE
jgi:hypothetical protein